MEPSAAPAARVGGILLRLQSDERLAELASSGSHDAFETLVRRYRGGLLRSCRRILPGDRAEDAVQETLLQAHRALARNGAPERFRPWLHRIAVNTSLRQLNQGGDTVPLSEEMDGVEGPETVQERRERLRSTVGAIDRLPGRQRRALVLRELEGRSHAEIARELGLSGGAVRQLIHRARNTVRSAASALTPPAFLLRMLEAGSAAPIGDAAAGGAGVAVGAKLVIAAVVAGGVAGGAAIERSVGPPQGSGAAEAREPSGGRSTAHALTGTGGAEHRGSRSADRSGSDRGPGGGGEGSSGPGSGSSSGGSGSWGGKSGRSGVSGGSRESGGEIDSDQLESVEDDSSGSGSAEAESEADSSGSGSSGSGSESSGSGSLTSGSSGSGPSGSESSGSGSGSSATISSGSGSSGSGGSGSSGSGSGSDDD